MELRLLERDVELAKLDERVAGAVRGRGSLVMIGGEAGVGKTSLVRAVCSRAAVRCAVGACDPLMTPRPLGPVLDLARELGGRVASVAAEAPDRDRLFAGVIDELSVRRGTVVVIEDIQWADEATFDFLRLLGRRIGSTRAAALVTYRSDDVQGQLPVSTLLGDFATNADVHRLRLHPLSVDAVSELSGDDADAVELHRVTGGNPFFVTEVLAAGAGAVPTSVRDAVLARATRLSPAALEVSWLVALVPRRIEGWLLAAICRDVAAVEDCVLAGLLIREGEAVAFRHELAREALAGAVPAARGMALHRRMLEVLRATPATRGDLARLAYHAEAAGDRALVSRYAPEAGMEAARLGSHREAAAQYARALRFAEALEPAATAELLERRSYECYFTGQMGEALAAREQALEIWRDLGDEARAGASLTWIAQLAWFAGDRERADRAGAEAVAILEPLGVSAALARAYSQRSSWHMVGQDFVNAVRLGELAIAMAERLGDRDTLTQALNNVGTARLTAGDVGGRVLLHRSRELAEATGGQDHVARAWINLAATDVRAREYPLAASELVSGIEYCGKHELEPQRLFLLAWCAQAALDQGRWDEAADQADEVLAHPGALNITRITALAVLGRLRARRGDPDPWSPLDEALELANRAGELRRLVPVVAARAEAAWLGGADNVAAETDVAWSAVCAHGSSWDVGELAVWRWRAGAAVNLPPIGSGTPFALQVAGDPVGAAALWEARGCRYDRALALIDSDDHEYVRTALAELEELGARPAATIAVRRLRELGAPRVPRGPRPATRANPAGLTRRETEVVELIAEGLRNAEIAQRLVLSQRTVEHHVAAILRKLGVHDRAQASVEARRLGFSDPT